MKEIRERDQEVLRIEGGGSGILLKTFPVTSKITAIVGTKIDIIHVIDLVFRTCQATSTKGKNEPEPGPALPINFISERETCYELVLYRNQSQ